MDSKSRCKSDSEYRGSSRMRLRDAPELANDSGGRSTATLEVNYDSKAEDTRQDYYDKPNGHSRGLTPT